MEGGREGGEGGGVVLQLHVHVHVLLFQLNTVPPVQ